MSLSIEFRQSIKPLIIMNSILATGLIEYFTNNKINAIGMIYGFISSIIYVIMANFISFPSKILQVKQPFMIQLTYKLYVYSDYIFQIVTILAGILRRKKIKQFTVQLETCIRKMEQLNVPMNFSKYFRQQCILILLLIIFLITMTIADSHWFMLFVNGFWPLVATLYVERYPFLILSAVDVTFVYWMIFVKIRFGQLNEVLKNMLTTTIDSPQHKRVLRMKNNRKYDSPSYDIHKTYESNKDLIKIKKIREIHLELIKCARNINDAYGLHILMSTSIAFVLTTTIAYNLYNQIVTGAYRTHTTQIIIYFYWMTYFGLKIIIISHVCESTVKELLFSFVFFLHAMNTGDALCELYEPSTSKEFRAEIRDFTSQLLQNPLSFTSCGLFYLNHTLIRNVISTVTTYLIILIQVGNVPPQALIQDVELSNEYSKL